MTIKSERKAKNGEKKEKKTTHIKKIIDNMLSERCDLATPMITQSMKTIKNKTQHYIYIWYFILEYTTYWKIKK